ncbi:hypothetical protein EHI8A_061100 [Entamoeba histolytica HM-1:IMSS-B]|uniref:Uncharacterized protein n=4 Tax=Entamoeba histolytica TaxID=5759 RepID=M3U186_ENTH1|nr:Hypothetical protein EHI5A_094060 [Entamoeba histolytica KU27]EMH75855.1 hypothetical protein EHI8A_061100 [Entamoeba histolytica HM-1:IMSS-B]EMS13441.1 hypothetical protein KM1_113690 [Entamoeba histolytica HM-3:IMSS]ENY62917.1 hypothetical protein EHI7A_058890 [Entamoeba histolytica HM-1:IMSS-A]
MKNKEILYNTLISIDFIERMFVNSTIDYEKYVQLCSQEFERFIRIYPLCHFNSINEMYNSFELEHGLGYQRVITGKPTIIQHKIISNGRLIIEVTINILSIINLDFMKIYDLQEYLRLLNVINVQLSPFETKNVQFEQNKKELREFESRLKGYTVNDKDKLATASTQIVYLLNSTLNVFKEINN